MSRGEEGARVLVLTDAQKALVEHCKDRIAAEPAGVAVGSFLSEGGKVPWVSVVQWFDHKPFAVATIPLELAESVAALIMARAGELGK